MSAWMTDEHQMLREMVRGMCAEYAPVDVVRAMVQSNEPEQIRQGLKERFG